jgi:uncharacterized protein (AIM24 family)
LLQVHVGHVGVQDPSVQFSVRLLKGFKNILFGGDGIFLASLRGPGKIMLQSMPIVNLAEEIFRHGTATPAADKPGNLVGDIIGGMFRGE